MFIIYLLLTFSISLLLSLGVARMFRPSMNKIMNRIIADEVSGSWIGYLKYAMVVVGVSGGVPLYQLENVLNSGRLPDSPKVIMDMNFFLFEAFRSVINTLQSLAWVLLFFFFTTLIAVIIVKTSEMKRNSQKEFMNK